MINYEKYEEAVLYKGFGGLPGDTSQGLFLLGENRQGLDGPEGKDVEL